MLPSEKWLLPLVAISTTMMLTALSPGYVHPDEMFQSIEVAARDFGMEQVEMAWEWKGEIASVATSKDFAPCRSVVFPWLAAHFPVLIIRRVMHTSSGLMMAVASRLWCCLLSIGHDFLLRILWRQFQTDVNAAHWLYRTSWTTAIFQARPLSNCYEFYFFTICAIIAFHPHSKKAFLLGAIAAIGCFVRFTLAFWVIPLGIFAVVTSTKPGLTLLQGLVSFLLVAVSLISIDSLYFGQGLIFTPLRNAIFNASASRLKRFGLHARCTHILFNLPFLFGPHLLYTAIKRYLTTRHNNKVHTLTACFVLALTVLSIAPHQEARFLLPAAGLVFGLAGSWWRNQGKWLKVLSCVANLVLWFFFAFAHQAGPARLALYSSSQQDTEAPATLQFFGTYLIPRSLFSSTTQIFDTDSDIVIRSCRHVIAAAASIPKKKLTASIAHRNFTMTLRTSFFPHFSGEYLPSKLSHLRLLIFDLTFLDCSPYCTIPIDNCDTRIASCEYTHGHDR